ncbi:arrestin domain-containing protein 1-like [Contarinia nasturtii]|uniref:arrestin domain-containing protein 1-like n=1 Tax=Contarinia nasturtii TaxID=265458 RepID=UPI0012D435BE|nr:arrestin domain-containing protein 1-like [Contarinia nasturtii]
MSPKILNICFDNSSKAYYAGQKVEGHVQVELESEKLIRNIEIHFEGKTYMFLTRKLQNEEEFYTKEENHLDYTEYLLGSNLMNSCAGKSLSAGTHSFPFAYVLPGDIPSTICGEKGSVSYSVNVILRFANDRSRKEKKEFEEFVVISPLNLNEIPNVKEPVNLPLEKSFSSNGLNEPLRANISIPATGYTSGQTIPITMDIENMSNVPVKQIKVILNRKESYFMYEPQFDVKHKSNKITEILLDGVDAKSSIKRDQLFEIPPLQPTNSFSNIQWCYELMFVLKMSGMHENVQGTIPILLGTIPISDVVAQSSVPDNCTSISITTPESFIQKPDPLGCLGGCILCCKCCGLCLCIIVLFAFLIGIYILKGIMSRPHIRKKVFGEI